VCCYPNAQCITVASPNQCPSFCYYMPNVTTCNPYPCGGACCTATGGCTYTNPLGCNGQWQGPYTTCNPNPCPGACCDSQGFCLVVPPAQCVGGHRIFLPGQTSCTPNPCVGACCLPPNVNAFGNSTGTHCVITTAGNCPQGQFHGIGSVCAVPAASSNFTTCCPANFDHINGVQIADIFSFLNAWFNGCLGQPGAPCNGANVDFDGSGTVTIGDIFSFLGVWFSGCS
jgi:hypothetical protein